MMRRFCAYLEKVFDFSRHVSGLMDARQRPRITTAAVWLSGFLMAVTRAGSPRLVKWRPSRRNDSFYASWRITRGSSMLCWRMPPTCRSPSCVSA